MTEYHEDYWIRGADGEKQLGIAVPVPPHGDLIDRDAYEYPGDLMDEPVIIPAEEGE